MVRTLLVKCKAIQYWSTYADQIYCFAQMIECSIKSFVLVNIHRTITQCTKTELLCLFYPSISVFTMAEILRRFLQYHCLLRCMLILLSFSSQTLCFTIFSFSIMETSYVLPHFANARPIFSCHVLFWLHRMKLMLHVTRQPRQRVLTFRLRVKMSFTWYMLHKPMAWEVTFQRCFYLLEDVVEPL